MLTMAGAVSKASRSLDMQSIENSIIEAMSNGQRTVIFELVDKINKQSSGRIHLLGIESLRQAGYTIERTPQYGTSIVTV